MQLAITYPVVVPDDGESLFNYVDTAATKAGLVVANGKLENGKIAIVGVGGTGSYVLDFVAKTPVAEIHIFDRDVLSEPQCVQMSRCGRRSTTSAGSSKR